ncbi:DUF4397 domain-containing protein [Paraliomyxa miuraensis]|uniref:DUF4397 domain-containing protein n=1 Tax=Paraliomyxa miuraensis TaxID=376150 RepID=UPI002250F01F|nr:DUF4397 domain-containing protein [Paraliomyxa miuraensis]MCX4242259.1 DUF4397 domain-containing protein [Paraliomyxa miuraensis]
MHSYRAFLLALPLPLTLLTGCPGDDTGDTGADEPTTTDATTDAPTTTGAPTTTTATTTDEPTTTTPTATTTDEPTTGETGDGEDTAMIRVIHLGVATPPVDVFSDGQGPVFEGLEFRKGTDYAELSAGDHIVQIAEAGGSPADALLAPMLTLDANTSYTTAAIGDMAMTDGAPGLQAIVLIDDGQDVPTTDVRVVVVHAAPAVGQVDIYELSADPIPLIENVDFASAVSLGNVEAGPLVIGIDVDDDSVPDSTFSIDASVLGGMLVNVYANNDDQGALALVAQLPDGSVLTVPPN